MQKWKVISTEGKEPPGEKGALPVSQTCIWRASRFQAGTEAQDSKSLCKMQWNISNAATRVGSVKLQTSVETDCKQDLSFQIIFSTLDLSSRKTVHVP